MKILESITKDSGDQLDMTGGGQPQSAVRLVANQPGFKSKSRVGTSPIVQTGTNEYGEPTYGQVIKPVGTLSPSHKATPGPSVPSSLSGTGFPSVPNQPYTDNYEIRSNSQSGNPLVDAYSLDVPPGVSVDGNIAKGQRFLNQLRGAHGYELEKGAVNALKFYYEVRNGGPMDYKQHSPYDQYGNFTMGRGAYENFGNFNYGAYGAARGFKLPELLVAAGEAQKRAGTSRPEWQPTYGDDPIDQMWIKRGFAYAQPKMGSDKSQLTKHYYRTN